MKLKNVKVGQRVKIKKRVGLRAMYSFTLREDREYFDAVVTRLDLGDTACPVLVKLNSGRCTWGNAEDLKLIEDAE